MTAPSSPANPTVAAYLQELGTKEQESKTGGHIELAPHTIENDMRSAFSRVSTAMQTSGGTRVGRVTSSRRIEKTTSACAEGIIQLSIGCLQGLQQLKNISTLVLQGLDKKGAPKTAGPNAMPKDAFLSMYT